jgi:hypothetical protein
MELLYNEAEKGENKSNLITFVVLFIIIALSAVICCYLNYTFTELLAEYVFYMFVGSLFGDILVCRPALLMLFALLRFFNAKRLGYKKEDFKNIREIKEDLNKAIKDMFTTRKKIREDFGNNSARGSGD